MQTPSLQEIDTIIGHVRGPKGDPGDTPEITVTDITGGHRVTITVGEEEPIVFDVMDGEDGQEGPAGKSAYESAQDGGYSGTEAQFESDLANVGDKYEKPSGGIPSTDMSIAVQTSLGKADTALQASDKGSANGVAGLDASGKVPSSQLPSYVDDVIEGFYYNGAFYEDSAHTTAITAETGKIYVDLATNKSYRYSGSVFYRIDDITVDDALSDSSTNPVQNKIVTGKMKSTAQDDKIYHLGFYLDANGDLCY